MKNSNNTITVATLAGCDIICMQIHDNTLYGLDIFLSHPGTEQSTCGGNQPYIALNGDIDFAMRGCYSQG